MYYTGFSKHITRRYGIVVRNWPLEEFKNPSSISSRAEAETLWNSLTSGTTHFYRMTNQEFQDWLDGHNASGQGAEGAATNGGGYDEGEPGSIEMEGTASQGMPSVSPTSTLTPTPTPAPTRAPVPAGTSNFLAMTIVTDANGVAIPVKSTTRKKRSDAGKPRKKRNTGTVGGESGVAT